MEEATIEEALDLASGEAVVLPEHGGIVAERRVRRCNPGRQGLEFLGGPSRLIVRREDPGGRDRGVQTQRGSVAEPSKDVHLRVPRFLEVSLHEVGPELCVEASSRIPDRVGT